MNTKKYATLDALHEPIDLFELHDVFIPLWREALENTDFKPSKLYDEMFYDKHGIFPGGTDEALYDSRIEFDLCDYFYSGINDVLKEKAIEGGIVPMLTAWIKGVPVYDIIA